MDITNKLKGIFNVDQMLPSNLEQKKSIKSKKKDGSWEKVSSSSQKDCDFNSPHSVIPSRSDVESGENNLGGTGILKKKETFDFSQSIIKESQERKEARKNRHKKPIESREEWEQPSRAKNTSDVYAGNMGFTPNRSSFEEKPLSKVNIPQIEKLKEKTRLSQDAGIAAAKMKSDLDKIMLKSMAEKANGDWSWEKEAQEKINTNLTKNISVTQPTKLADSMLKKIEVKNDLAGIFKSPEQPSDESIKRNSSNMKEERKTRQSDRSWEKVSAPKKLGKF